MTKVTRAQKSGAKKFVKEAVLLLPRLVRLLYKLMRDPRVPRGEKALLAAALAYVLSPIDLVPDFIPVIGEADDLLVVSLLLLRLIAEAGEDVVRENWSGSEDLIPWIRSAARMSKLILPDSVVRPITGRFGG